MQRFPPPILPQSSPALIAATSQPADTNITHSAQYCYVRSLFQDVAGQTYTHIRVVDGREGGGEFQGHLIFLYSNVHAS